MYWFREKEHGRLSKTMRFNICTPTDSQSLCVPLRVSSFTPLILASKFPVLSRQSALCILSPLLSHQLTARGVQWLKPIYALTNRDVTLTWQSSALATVHSPSVEPRSAGAGKAEHRPISGQLGISSWWSFHGMYELRTPQSARVLSAQ